MLQLLLNVLQCTAETQKTKCDCKCYTYQKCFRFYTLYDAKIEYGCIQWYAHIPKWNIKVMLKVPLELLEMSIIYTNAYSSIQWHICSCMYYINKRKYNATVGHFVGETILSLAIKSKLNYYCFIASQVASNLTKLTYTFCARDIIYRSTCHRISKGGNLISQFRRVKVWNDFRPMHFYSSW